MPAKHRVLVVDDAPENISTVKKMLMNTGILVTQAGSEFGAFNVIEQYGKQADAIVVNLSLQASDPLELAEKLRQNERYSKIPIVFTCDQITLDTIEKIKKLQIEHVIKKPFNEEYFRSTLHAVLKTENNE